MKKILLFSIVLFGLVSCYTTKTPSAKCATAKQLRLSKIEMKRLQWFAARMHRDGLSDLTHNASSSYCLIPIAVDTENIGLVAIWRRGHTHEGLVYFINGKQSITPLKFGTPISPVRFDRPEQSPEQSKRINSILERALAHHSDEIEDSLRFKIKKAVGSIRISSKPR